MIGRDDILEFMASADYRPMRRRALAKALDVSKKRYPEFREVLAELEDEGYVRLGRGRRYMLLTSGEDEEIEGIAGTFIGKGDYGFFRPEGGGEDYYVGRAHTGGAMNGDRVLLEPGRRRGPRRRGRVVKVLERRTDEVVGVLREGWGQPFILPGERSGDEGIRVRAPAGRSIEDFPYGNKVAARITRYPSRSRGAEAELVADLGPAGTVETETAAIIREFGLRDEFPPEVLAETEKIPAQISDDQLAHRVDYREQRCLTVDPPDAADFDDAVFLERTEEGWRLYVHIADVAWAVPERGALDAEARERSTSVYMPGHVIPMLPPRLSSLLCSLLPGEARLCQTAVIDFGPEGDRLSFRIERSVIRSALRLHYGQVRRLIEGAPRPGEEVPDWALESLQAMHGFSQKLRARRFADGGVFLDMPEVRVRVGDDGETQGVELRRQDFSHQVVEEFMLAANRAVAEFMVTTELPGIFRWHEPPDEDRLQELSTFVKTFGLSFKPPFSRRKVQKLVESVKGKPFEPTVMLAVLTSMKQARYTGVDGEHYALAFRPYCHFTSPIRRYPDLVVHRALSGMYPPGESALDPVGRGGRRRGRRAQVADRRAAAGRMETLAQHCSDMERRAAEAERRLTRFRQMELLGRSGGGERSGVITGVTEFGLFVRIDDFFVEGLVHVASMSDRYRYLPRRQELQGQRTGRRWRLGDAVTVRVLRLDLTAGRVELELA
ncbi:MAG: ribonuclease R family protein [Planctomycetota bacterium]